MAAKKVLAITLGTAFIVGFIYMIVLRVFGGPMIWLSIIGLIGGTIYGGFLLWMTSKNMVDGEQYKEYYLYGSYVVWGISGALFLCACCNQKNIRIGIAVMKCTAQFIQGTP